MICGWRVGFFRFSKLIQACSLSSSQFVLQVAWVTSLQRTLNILKTFLREKKDNHLNSYRCVSVALNNLACSYLNVSKKKSIRQTLTL